MQYGSTLLCSFFVRSSIVCIARDGMGCITAVSAGPYCLEYNLSAHLNGRFVSRKITSGCSGCLLTASLMSSPNRKSGLSAGLPGLPKTPGRCLLLASIDKNCPVAVCFTVNSAWRLVQSFSFSCCTVQPARRHVASAKSSWRAPWNSSGFRNLCTSVSSSSPLLSTTNRS